MAGKRKKLSSSIEAQNLISGLLRQKPEERLSIPAILAHPWFCSGAFRNENCSISKEQCEVPAGGPQDINTINVGNLFYGTAGGEAKLSHKDYSRIANDFYTQHLGSTI